MLFSCKNLLVIFSVILIISALTEAAPTCVGENGEDCSMFETITHHGNNVYNFAKTHLSNLWGWIKKNAHPIVSTARKALEDVEKSYKSTTLNPLDD
ncbi:unnamed protein product [Allacma fusca]|uniref:Uncharacterized protein n=1 Tax=Allacma fusca TaxID=39272 RepID=A0A8J2Q4N7_9HEXA|nr:unnamed protein product [Allacma fusca]